MNRRFFLHLPLLATIIAVSAIAQAENVRVLILSGQNNHNWRETTPELKKILLKSGRFTVEVTEHPEECSATTLKKFDCILSNWNTCVSGGIQEWPEQTRKALLDFVRDGHGFVVVHAGGTMFADWPDFQKLIGATWGKGTGHGSIHAFEVKFVDGAHPITKGLASFTITDELWHHIVEQPEKKILATALSTKEHGGSGRDEPVLMVTQFGKGRCFNLVLGHNKASMCNTGFQELLDRGVEWAATGKVSAK